MRSRRSHLTTASEWHWKPSKLADANRDRLEGRAADALREPISNAGRRLGVGPCRGMLLASVRVSELSHQAEAVHSRVVGANLIRDKAAHGAPLIRSGPNVSHVHGSADGKAEMAVQIDRRCERLIVVRIDNSAATSPPASGLAHLKLIKL